MIPLYMYIVQQQNCIFIVGSTSTQMHHPDHHSKPNDNNNLDSTITKPETKKGGKGVCDAARILTTWGGVHGSCRHNLESGGGCVHHMEGWHDGSGSELGWGWWFWI